MLNILNNPFQSLSEGNGVGVNVVYVKLMRQVASGFKKSVEFTFDHFIFIFRNLKAVN